MLRNVIFRLISHTNPPNCLDGCLARSRSDARHFISPNTGPNYISDMSDYYEVSHGPRRLDSPARLVARLKRTSELPDSEMKADRGASSNCGNRRLGTFPMNEADTGRVRIDAAIFILRRGAIHDVSPSTASYCVWKGVPSSTVHDGHSQPIHLVRVIHPLLSWVTSMS